MSENFNNNNYREWMYNRIDQRTMNISAEFAAGVEEFMTFANAQPISQSSGGMFYCPCIRCKNNKFLKGKQVAKHIYSRGFMPGYYIWYMHGEQWNVDLGSTSYGNTSHDVRDSEEQVEHVEDRFVEMVNNAFPDQFIRNDHNNHEEDQGNQNIEEPNIEAKKLYDMLESAKNPLYDGCQEGHSQLSLAARFMNIKTDYNLPEKCMDSWAELFTEYLPENNQSTNSYYETEKLMRNLALLVHTIDVCINNCMIFWKEDEKLDKCRFCQSSRYKASEGRTNIPYSRMWYFPISDRMKRMYQFTETAMAMRWHAEHESEEGEMCHPSDAADWKNFQAMHPQFANEPRNVYFGLCTDGFNPFGMSKNHSLWPIIMTPYNLPPGMCMKEEYLWLTILNSGPNHPRASLDIFLRPLIDELKELWSTGVEAYDVSRNENFNLRAVLMWTISDFPAYGMLSGWTTHGRLSCPICMDETKAFHLPNGRKMCWFDCHRRFLPYEHPLRKNKRNFLKGKDALHDYPPQSLTGEQVLYERIRNVNPPKTSDCGGNGHEVKKKGYGKWHNWHKESIFWELSYWTDLNIRHNLDVMHIEKNFFDNIMNTVMNVKDKTKDTVKARLDLARFCSRKELHVDSRGIAHVPIFRLTGAGKERLLKCVRNDVKFPDGYASDLATCVDLEGGKFAGMKSHDCHVFMQRLLPFIFAELLPRNVHLALAGTIT